MGPAWSISNFKEISLETKMTHAPTQQGLRTDKSGELRNPGPAIYCKSSFTKNRNETSVNCHSVNDKRTIEDGNGRNLIVISASRQGACNKI